MRLTRLCALTLPVIGMIALSSCTQASQTADPAAGGTGGGQGGGASAAAQPAANTKVGKAAKLVPASVKAKGKLTVAMDASYAPFEYFDKDNKTIIGFDADLSKALAGKMGLTAVDVNAGFDTILAGLTSGKHDLGMSAFSVTPERAKTVDFVVYLTGGTGIAVPKGNPKNLTMDPKQLCGLRIAGQKGSIQGIDYLPEFSKACVTAGNKPITIRLFPSQNEANLALSSGRVDAVMADSISMAYQSKLSGGRFELAPGEDYEPTKTGVALKNGSNLVPAISAAMHEVVADGTMKKLMNKWGMPDQSLGDDAGEVVK
ncbi:ABC transporter substrate-binding protein [Segeticoccus rhizosphaerae]|uniref:ABC transporter substrate-binding protein n=1 Tax=Segeticoccus rhizosphaerae TaxID=1104777 RepID=UPI0010C046BF|nr:MULTISPECIES: ABC transporter substrate-binding protein [Intrasporangiaceae]